MDVINDTNSGNDQALDSRPIPAPMPAQEQRLNPRLLSREQCMQELLVLASKYPKALSTSRLHRGLATSATLLQYEKGVLIDRNRRAILQRDAAKAMRLIGRLRFLSRISTAAAANRLGVTIPQFRRLVHRKSIRPVAGYPNPHYQSGPQAHLWGLEDLDRLACDADVLLARELTVRRRSSSILRTLFSRTAGSGQLVLREALRGDEESFLVWLDWLEDHDCALVLNREALIQDAAAVGMFRRQEGGPASP